MAKAKERWSPNESAIDKKEILGRRAFGNCTTGAGNRLVAGSFRLDVFYETRPTDHLSLDRLGIDDPQDHVLVELRPCYEYVAKAKGKEFKCWAAFKANEVRDDIRPAAITAQEGNPEPPNPYHSELQLDGYRAPNQQESLAFKLSTLSKRIEPPQAAAEAATNSQPPAPDSEQPSQT